jgi:hypothetical protein
MAEGKNRQWTLAARPQGEPKDSDFKLVETDIPEPGKGEMLIRTIYLSLDPYMRGRMNDGPSYAPPVPIGGVMVGGAVSQVVKSNHPDYAEGDIVEGRTGWQDYAISDGGEGIRKVDPSLGPISTANGVLGMPGMTAYCGLLNLGQPKKGETLVVGAASGAVGGLVGQIAKIKGCRAVGVAGSKEKCNYVVDELGFDACINYKDDDFREQLAKAVPDGIDIYFENVGGDVFDAVMDHFNLFSRMPVCGTIAHYNDPPELPGPDRLPKLVRLSLTRRLMIRGFIVWDYWDQMDQFLKDMSGWIRDGKIKYREHIVDGLENAPAAFRGLLKGENFGKLQVRVSEDPTL